MDFGGWVGGLLLVLVVVVVVVVVVVAVAGSVSTCDSSQL